VKPVNTTYVPIGLPSSDLSADRRRLEWDELSTEKPLVDLVVVGGGITGVGVALDAASRGLHTVLLEREDLAFGTSRWSSKLVHGGLRYLATGHADVAWESAVERGHLMTTIAPHLIRALPQIVPVMTDTSWGSAALTRAGFLAGDALRAGARTPASTLPPAHWISREKVRSLAPAIDVPDVRGGIMAWDGQLVDDARLVIAAARTAASFGARILTRVDAVSVTSQGVRLRDRLSGEEFDLPARNVITATGVWAQELDPRVHVHPSRGTHVLIDARRLGSPRAALTIPVPGMSGRYCFLLPRPDNVVLAGITDIGVDRIEDVPRAPAEDIEWIVEQVNRVLAEPLSTRDVLGAFAGLRPLVTMDSPTDGGHEAQETDAQETSDISRKHLVSRSPDGVITVTGGKLTTYRRMAQDAVDLITDRPCRSRSIALVGASPELPPRSPGFFDDDPLVMRYGAEADRVRALAELLPDPESALAPLAEHTSAARVDIVHSILHEGALDADDILSRRLRLDSVDADVQPARTAIEEVIDTLARSGVAPAGVR
jgi:glycerol-3-phosphate dehydrogenase